MTNLIEKIKKWFCKEDSEKDFAEKLIEEIREERKKQEQEGEEILNRLLKEGVKWKRILMEEKY